jgi:hypothetical protein
MILAEHAKNVTSQRGEDGIIEKIFDVIGTKNKVCVDVGAGDGDRTSNTWNLLNFCGWRGVLFEPKASAYKSLHNRYLHRPDVETRKNMIGFNEDDNLIDCLLVAPPTFDLLSIDIDGCDYHVWDAIKKYRPRVVCIEHNPTVPIDVEFVQPKDMSVNQGSSLLSLYLLGKQKGYELVAATELNAMFVVQEEFHLFDIEDNSPEALNPMDESKKTRLFQGYDGTLFLVGENRLIWKNKTITHEDIQVLPKSERMYG